MPVPCSRGLGCGPGCVHDDELQQLPWTAKKRHVLRVQGNKMGPWNLMTMRWPR